MPTTVLDIEQHLLLLELEPPFDKRDVQLARRRMAKRWHPDIAPQGRQFEHERHLKAINEAADQLERLAETSRGGRGLAQRRPGERRRRPPRARGGRQARVRGRAARPRAAADQAKHDPFASRVPDHSVVHRYARCLSYPEWGVGTVAGHLLHRRSHRRRGGGPAVGARQVQPRHPHRARRQHEVRRLLQARPRRRARRALHDRRPAGDGRGRLRARRPAPGLRARRRAAQRRGAAPDDARLLAGGQPRGGRPLGARLGARRRRPPRRPSLRRAHLRGHGRRSTSPRRPPSGPPTGVPPTRAPGSAWVACACALLDREGALEALGTRLGRSAPASQCGS